MTGQKEGPSENNYHVDQICVDCIPQMKQNGECETSEALCDCYFDLHLYLCVYIEHVGFSIAYTVAADAIGVNQSSKGTNTIDILLRVCMLTSAW